MRLFGVTRDVPDYNHHAVYLLDYSYVGLVDNYLFFLCSGSMAATVNKPSLRTLSADGARSVFRFLADDVGVF